MEIILQLKDHHFKYNLKVSLDKKETNKQHILIQIKNKIS